MLSVSVVIPTYNERESIAETLRDLYETLAARKHEILVVDDNSPDGTGDAVRGLSKEIPSLRLLSKKREGVGAAIQYGFDRARCEVFMSMDGDRTYDTDDIPRFLRRIDDGCDLVLGSRHMQGGAYEANSLGARIKKMISLLGSCLARLISGIRVCDFSGNFRAIRRSAWKKIRTREKTNSLALEMILKTAYAGLIVNEIPVKAADRAQGASKRNPLVEAPKFFYKLFYYTLVAR